MSSGEGALVGKFSLYTRSLSDVNSTRGLCKCPNHVCSHLRQGFRSLRKHLVHYQSEDSHAH